VIVIHETAPARDQAIRTHGNLFRNIEFSSRSYEAIIPNRYCDTIGVNTVEMKVHHMLDSAVPPNRNLMGEGYDHQRETSRCSDRHPLQTPSEGSHRADELRQQKHPNAEASLYKQCPEIVSYGRPSGLLSCHFSKSTRNKDAGTYERRR
jgi:hypothetical protein